MVNKVYVDSDGFLQVWVIGDQSEDSVREMGEKMAAYVTQLRSQRKRVLVLDNLIKMGKTTSEARREVGRIAKSLDFDRGAMVGDSSMFMRYSTNLMLRAIGKSNLRYFGNIDSARRWLLKV
jgi:UDP-N-acetylmuramyl pentapeptide synthase